jgi:hypothetical protein
VFGQITEKRAIVKMYLKYPPNMERNDAKIDLRSKPEFFFSDELLNLGSYSANLQRGITIT